MEFMVTLLFDTFWKNYSNYPRLTIVKLRNYDFPSFEFIFTWE